MIDEKISAQESIEERLSALFDGESLGKAEIPADAESKAHFQNWSLIGAAMRKELSPKIDMNFADKVAAKVALEATPKLDQTEISQKVPLKFRMRKYVKQFSIAAAELAVAASVAVVTVVGWQTWNAEANLSVDEPAVNATLGSVGGVNLASYQNSQGSSVIRLENSSTQAKDVKADRGYRAESNAEQAKKLEAERINNYIRGYVLNTASAN